MSLNLNKVTIAGNLTKDLELKTIPNETIVGIFSVASNESYKDKNGEKQTSTEFHNIVCYGKQAEIIEKYFKKGSSIYLDGKLKTQSWEDKETGKKMYRTEIILQSFNFVNNANSKKENTESYKDNSEKVNIYDSYEDLDSGKENNAVQYADDNINQEDIPF